MVKIILRESGTTVYSIGNTAQSIFRREHNIVNFRNDKWKMHNLSIFVHWHENLRIYAFFIGRLAYS